MSDRLEEALVDVISRIEAGEALTAVEIREGYPDCWEAIGDVLDLRAKLADVGGLESTLAKARVACETKLRVVDDGRYEGFRLLGEGGMGMVYWALDTELNREVAFKVVRPDARARRDDAPSAPIHVAAPCAGTPASQAFETLKARFLQEAWVTAGLEHPGIVPVYEVGQTPQGVPYYTMRFVRGSRTLTQAMDDVRTRPFEERLALLEPFLRVCDTMRYAHAHGVVHRDLKPDNVALGEFGEVVVLDWGIAKIRDRPDAAAETWKRRLDEFREAADLRTHVGAMGTPGYMSPEAATGHIDDVDERSDVYSLGAMLFQLLAGRLPYEFRTYGELLHAMHDGPPPAPDSIDSTIHPVLSAICLRALASDRGARPQTVDALATDVRAWLAKRARDHEIDVLEREATVSMAALADLQGDALLKQLDRVHAAATRLLDRAPESETARGLLREAERRRELGIRQRERIARRRVARRALIVGLALTAAGTAGAAWFVDGKNVTARAVALANASKAAESIDPMRALLLAREAARVKMSPEVVSQLHSALVGSLEDVVLRGHKGSVSAAAFSPTDDNAVVTASADHTARIWKLDGSGSVTLVGHDRSVWPAVFSPDGTHVLTGSEDCTARLWDLQGNQTAKLEGHTDTVCAVAYSPAVDHRIVTGSYDGTARLWTSDGALITVLAGHSKQLNGVSWSPTGDRLVTVSEDGDVRVWDAGGSLVGVLPHDLPVRAAAFSPDGCVLLTGTSDGVVRLWDVETSRATTVERAGSAVKSVAFSPDGKHFATGRSDGTARLWNSDGSPVTNLLGHTNSVDCTTFSPDSQLVATTGSWDGTGRVWDLQGRCIAVLRGHAGYVAGVTFSPEFDADHPSRLLTSSSDGTARTWRLKGAEIETYRSTEFGMHALAVSGVGNHQVLVVPPIGPAFIRGEDGKPAQEFGEATEELRTARFSKDGRRVVVAGRSGWVRVFELDGRSVISFHAHEMICSADFSPVADRILTWSDDATAKIWDLAGNCIRTFDKHEDRVMCAAFSPDGRRIITGSWDCMARIFDVDSGDCIVTLKRHRHTVCCVAFSHRGERVLTASFDASVRIWDLSGGEPLELLHASATNVAAFSPDDAEVAVGCSDGSTWLWNSTTGDLLSQLPGHSACVLATEFVEPDGRRLATACQDGNVRVRCTLPEDVRQIVIGKITREFTYAEIVQYRDLLGPDYDVLLAAYEYLEPKLANAVVVSDVAAEVGADPALVPKERAAALEVLKRTFDDPAQVRERTWEVVRRRGLSPGEYGRALDWARIADDIDHRDLSGRVLLGVAQHRTGNEPAALRTLGDVDLKCGESTNWTHVTCIAALALVHHSLRDDDKARDDFARLDRLLDGHPEPISFVYQAFLDEALALRREIGSGK